MLGVELDKDVVTSEVPYGGVLFIINCIPDRSLENHSDNIHVWDGKLHQNQTVFMA